MVELNWGYTFLFDNILKYRIVISISLFWVCTFCSFYTQLKWKIIMCAYKNVFVYLFIRKFHFMWVIYLIEYVVCILLKPRPRPSARGLGSSRPSTSPSSLNWPSQQPASLQRTIECTPCAKVQSPYHWSILPQMFQHKTVHV